MKIKRKIIRHCLNFIGKNTHRLKISHKRIMPSGPLINGTQIKSEIINLSIWMSPILGLEKTQTRISRINWLISLMLLFMSLSARISKYSKTPNYSTNNREVWPITSIKTHNLVQTKIKMRLNRLRRKSRRKRQHLLTWKWKWWRCWRMIVDIKLIEICYIYLCA